VEQVNPGEVVQGAGEVGVGWHGGAAAAQCVLVEPEGVRLAARTQVGHRQVVLADQGVAVVRAELLPELGEYGLVQLDGVSGAPRLAVGLGEAVLGREGRVVVRPARRGERRNGLLV